MPPTNKTLPTENVDKQVIGGEAVQASSASFRGSSGIYSHEFTRQIVWLVSKFLFSAYAVQFTVFLLKFITFWTKNTIFYLELNIIKIHKLCNNELLSINMKSHKSTDKELT